MLKAYAEHVHCGTHKRCTWYLFNWIIFQSYSRFDWFSKELLEAASFCENNTIITSIKLS